MKIIISKERSHMACLDDIDWMNIPNIINVLSNNNNIINIYSDRA